MIISGLRPPRPAGWSTGGWNTSPYTARSAYRCLRKKSPTGVRLHLSSPFPPNFNVVVVRLVECQTAAKKKSVFVGVCVYMSYDNIEIWGAGGGRRTAPEHRRTFFFADTGLGESRSVLRYGCFRMRSRGIYCHHRPCRRCRILCA